MKNSDALIWIANSQSNTTFVKDATAELRNQSDDLAERFLRKADDLITNSTSSMQMMFDDYYARDAALI